MYSLLLVGLFLNNYSSAHSSADTLLLDTVVYLETPEGICLALRPAGLPVRVLAFAIDLLLRAALLAFAGAAWLYLGKFGLGLASISAFLLLWGYMVLFEVFNQGRSPGKQIMGLQVIYSDGTPINWSGSLTRNLLRMIDLLPFAYCIGILCMLNSARFQRLGDLVAGTLVIYEVRPTQRKSLAEVTASPSAYPLTRSEQHALLNFAERQQQLPKQRSEELAAIIAPALHIEPAQAVSGLYAIARSILGLR